MNRWGAGSHLYRIVTMLLFLVSGLTSCASNAGVFSGGKWQAGGLQHQHLRSLAVDPNNPQVIYAGDAQDGVFASTNGGMDWSHRSSGLTLPITIVALAFDDPGKKLYAAATTGIFVSADAAKHWSQVSGLPVGSYTSVVFDVNEPQVIYVASENHGVYASTNDGSSWTAKNEGLPVGISINNLAFDSVQHQLWAATNQGIYRSDNDGTLWHDFTNGLPSNIVVNTILPSANSGGDKGLVFAGTNHGFFLSNNDGARWMQSHVPLTGTSVNAIIIDYHTVTTVYAGTGIGVLRSEDNGQNWGGIASGLPNNQPIQALAIGANGYNQLYAGTHGIFLFPGNSNAFDPSQIFPVLLILAFFFALYRFSTRGRRRSQSIVKPGRKVESERTMPGGNSQTNMADHLQTNSGLNGMNKSERETDQGDEKDKEN